VEIQQHILHLSNEPQVPGHSIITTAYFTTHDWSYRRISHIMSRV